ncbi:MAG TPA: hypothetical protein PLV68_07040, partial [Ilumatobacteraceae bacterium]|nr:hypothetical protein [Ilumatobacteraceae bacterium]
YANGTTHYEERYRNGVREDADDGSPAVSKWRRDGTLRHVLRYRAGRRLANAATDSQTGRVTGAAPSRVL